MRTNIVIDDTTMTRAMKVSGLRTKREVVQQAMVEFIENRSRKSLAALKGKVRFAEGYDYKALREGKSA